MRIIIALIVTTNILFMQGFLHVDDGQIVEGNGNPILLKGFGLGGWLVPEGYMLHNRAWIEGFESPTEIENHVLDLIGPELAQEFWDGWHKNYVNKNDIDAIAEWGFNSLRIPFHYKQFSETIGTVNDYGYEIVDSLIAWCRPHNMYLILDMHCAPGAQNSGPISDSDGNANLWLDEVNKQHAIQIWSDIATYYAEETLIGGYDLINEPVLPSGVTSEELRQLYIDITNVIREVDQNHIIYIEGNWYGTDFTSLTPPWDTNMSYSFHKYWGSTSIATINYLLNIREEYNLPLWLGETGENSNQWYHEIVTLCQNNNIGWNWWTHKKFEKISSPLSVVISEEYNNLIDYWSGQAPQPTSEQAQEALFGMIENMKIENCLVNPGVLPSLLNPDYGSTAVPVKNHSIPGMIKAVDYDIGAVGVAYNDADYMNDGDGSYNSGWTYRNDGVDIEKNGNNSNGIDYSVGWTEPGDWMQYTINDVQEGVYDIKLSIAGQGGGVINTLLNEINLGYNTVPNTGGWYNWQTITISDVIIESEPQYLKIMTLQPGYNIESIEFILVEDLQGDVNLDGTVNVTDVVQMVNIILEGSDDFNDLADLNNDFLINIVDVLLLLNLILNQ